MDLNGFTKDARRIIGEYEKAGWEFHLSNRGHAIGRSPVSTRTCSVPKNLGAARALKNAEGDLARNLRRDAAERAVQAISDETVVKQEPTSPADAILLRGVAKKVQEDREQQFAEMADRSTWQVRPYSVTAKVTGPVVDGKFRPVHYLCVKCEQEFDSARSVGQHSRFCSAQGNVPQTDSLPDGAPRLATVPPAPVVEPEPVADPVLEQVRALVCPDLIAERDALRDERDSLLATLARLEADLDALRSLAEAIKVNTSA
jgi:hypothetical protein